MGKPIRRVRTSEGAQHYHLPVGAVIRPGRTAATKLPEREEWLARIAAHNERARNRPVDDEDDDLLSRRARPERGRDLLGRTTHIDEAADILSKRRPAFATSTMHWLTGQSGRTARSQLARLNPEQLALFDFETDEPPPEKYDYDKLPKPEPGAPWYPPTASDPDEPPDSYMDAPPPMVTGGSEPRNATLQRANPNGARNGPLEYQINCQRVAVVYELRRRGFDVEANPRRDGTYPQYDIRDMSRMFLNPTTGQRPKWYQLLTKDFGVVIQELGLPVGSRGIVFGAWANGEGNHLWNWEVVERNGKPQMRWYDGQIHRSAVTTRYRNRLKWDGDVGVNLMRTDDCTPNFAAMRAQKVFKEESTT